MPQLPGSLILDGSLTTNKIAANTITANNIAADVIVAGIVDGTTIEGATIVADGTTGQILVYNGTAASGNLIGAWSGTQGSDNFTNAFIAGLQVGLATGNQVLLEPFVNSPFNITTLIAGTLEAMLTASTTDVNEILPGFLGSVLLGTGTATKQASLLSSPLGATGVQAGTGAAIVLEASNDVNPSSDTAVITFGTVVTPDNTTVNFTPVMTMTPYALVVYSSASTITTITRTTGSSTIPLPGGVATVKAEAWGGGGGGGGGSSAIQGGNGGGGGEYASEPALAVSGSFSYTVGAAGSAGAISSNGGNGGTTTLSGSVATVTANGGGGGPTAGVTPGTGGTGSTNTVHNNGGAGGVTGFSGGGGGGSGGSGSAGNAGANGVISPSPSPGGAGGAAVTNGGAGGKGGTGETSSGSTTAGTAGSLPGGAGGGGGASLTNNSAGGAGGSGQVRVTYSSAAPPVGFSINFGAQFNDQFGTAIPTGYTAVTPQGLAGNLSIGTKADFTGFTVITGGAFSQFSKAWSIPANDAQVGTTYRMTLMGSGTQGSVAHNVNLQTTGGFAATIIPASSAAAGGTFQWKAVFELTAISTGSGLCNVVSTTWATGNSVSAGFSNSVTFNNSSAFTFEVQAEWSVVSGSPTITCNETYLERIGP